MNIEETQKQKKEGQIGRDNSIYVGDIPIKTTESDLFQLFSKVGQIYTVVIPRKEASIVESKCYAYVTFFDESSVPLAIETFNFYELNGSEIRVMPLDKNSVVNNKGNIVIKNLPKDMDNHTLKETFLIFGEILSCKVQKNSLGECTGVGYIHYRNPKVAELAIEMINKIVLDGKRLAAIQCIPKHKREKKKEDQENTFTNVYVKNIPKEIEDEGEIKAVLEQYGELTSFLAPRTPTGELKRFAFANYKTHEMAQAAIDALHDKPFPSSLESDVTFYVQRAKSKAERVEELTEMFSNMSLEHENKRNIYITNLPGELDEEDALRYFEQFGKIMSNRFGTDVRNNRSYGYIFYETSEAAAAAVEKANKSDYHGQPLDVTFFKSKKTRDLEKVSTSIYNNAYGGAANKGKKKVPPATQDSASATGYELYTLILSLAPNYTEKIAQAGFKNEEEFAKKITGMILELEAEEVKRAAVLGNVLSNYVEESLEQIIMHRRKDKAEKDEAIAIE